MKPNPRPVIEISICWQKTFRRDSLVEYGYYLVNALGLFWLTLPRMPSSSKEGYWVTLPSHPRLESHPDFHFGLHCLHLKIYFHVTTVFALPCDCLLALRSAGRIHRVDCPFYILDNVRNIQIAACLFETHYRIPDDPHRTTWSID